MAERTALYLPLPVDAALMLCRHPQSWIETVLGSFPELPAYDSLFRAQSAYRASLAGLSIEPEEFMVVKLSYSQLLHLQLSTSRGGQKSPLRHDGHRSYLTVDAMKAILDDPSSEPLCMFLSPAVAPPRIGASS